MKTSKIKAEQVLRLINTFLEEYAPSIKTNSLNTLNNYRLALDLYLLWLEEVKGISDESISVNCFEAKMVEEWISWLKNERNNSNASCNVRISSLRVFIKYLAKQDPAFRYLSVEVASVERQKVKKNKEEAMTRDAVEALFKVPSTKTVSGRRYYLMMVMFYSLGVRIDELLSLTIENVHLDTTIPSVTVIGKGAKPRTINLLSKPKKLLEVYIRSVHGDHPAPTAYVFFTNHKGCNVKMSQNAVRNQLKRYAAIAHETCSDVPLDVHPHLFRRSKATHMLEDGVNIYQISAFLGHENIITTEHYLNISLDEKNKAMATLESEEDKKITPKWHSKRGSLRDIAGTRGKAQQ